MIRLNLAAGPDIRAGWLNLDVIKQWPGCQPCDIVWDARKDNLPFEDDSVDEVYAGYLFLHLAPHFHARVIKDIHRVMKHRCLVRISEVEMAVVMKRWLEDSSAGNLDSLIWGEQGVAGRPSDWAQYEEFDKHCCGFTDATLKKFLSDSGFRNIRRVKIHPNCFYELTIDCEK